MKQSRKLLVIWTLSQKSGRCVTTVCNSCPVLM
jgi:hypothetical protein